MGIPTLRLQLFVEGKRKKFKTTKPSIFLGNAKLCDIKVKLNSDKANFIEIKVEDNRIYLVDKHTENGLYLDDIKAPVKEPVLYQDQLIRIGKTTIDLNIELEGVEEIYNEPHELELIKNGTEDNGNKRPKELEVSLSDEDYKNTKSVPSIFPLKTERARKEMLEQAREKVTPIQLNEAPKHQPVAQIKNTTQVQEPLSSDDQLISGQFEPSVTQAFIQDLLKNEVSESKFRVNELKEEAKSTKSQVDAKNKELHELEKEYLRLKKDIRLYEYNREELKERQKQLKDEVDEIKALLKDLEDRKNDIEQETSLLCSQREIAGVELESYKSEKKHLQEELDSINEELKQQKEELASFKKNMMDEYSQKKEEAIAYYETKVKEATDYFDQKERSFKEDKKEMQLEINHRLRECDEQIKREKENWQEELKRHQGELELIKEKVLNEAYAKKDSIIRDAEEQALKTAEEMNDLAENEKRSLIKEAHDQKRDILYKYEQEGQGILKELTEKGQKEKEKLIKEGEQYKKELFQEGEQEKKHLIEDGEKQRQELIKKGRSEADSEKEYLINEAKEEAERILHEEKVKLEREIKHEKEDLERELKEQRDAVEDELHNMRKQAQKEVEDMQAKFVSLEKDYDKLKETLFDERTERLSELNQEIENKRRDFEQEMVNKRLEFETRLSKEKEKIDAREKSRIRANIENVSENIMNLLIQKLEHSDYPAHDIIGYLPIDEVKEIVSDSFNVDAPVHNKKLGQFLLKNADASDKVKRFYKKIAILSSVLVVIIISFMINPNILNDIKSGLVKSVSLDKSATDSLVEERKKAFLSRPKLNPIRDGKLRESFTDSILYTAQYRELVVTAAYKKKWTVELNLHVLKDIDLSEEVVIKYMALEAPLHTELIEAFNNTYEEHKDKGIERLKVMEGEIVPKMKELFKTEKKWKEFLKFRELFFTRYRDSL